MTGLLLFLLNVAFLVSLVAFIAGAVVLLDRMTR